jgi:single-stranded DNA-binding protein
VELHPLESTGIMMAICRLCVPEEGTNGQVYTLWVPVHAFGTAREVLQDWEPGEAILVDGRLKWHSWQDRDGKRQGKLIVVALRVKRLHGAPVGQEVA